MKCVFSLCAFIGAACLLVGCGTANIEHFNEARPQVVASPDSVSAMLADAADRAATALETLSAIEHAKSPAVAVAPITGAPIELRRAVTVNWVGPVEPISQTLASRAGYTFVVVGTPPPVPIIVSLDLENKPVIEALRDIGLQLGLRGDVRVDSGRRLVEIHYPPRAGAVNEY